MEFTKSTSKILFGISAKMLLVLFITLDLSCSKEDIESASIKSEKQIVTGISFVNGSLSSEYIMVRVRYGDEHRHLGQSTKNYYNTIHLDPGYYTFYDLRAYSGENEVEFNSYINVKNGEDISTDKTFVLWIKEGEVIKVTLDKK